MAKSSTASFVVELPLIVAPKDARLLESRMLAGQRLYNAVLAEALTRLTLMRQSKVWQATIKTPKSQQRNKQLQQTQKDVGFTEYALQSFATQTKNNAQWQSRLGAHETQKIASRVWKAIFEYQIGKRVGALKRGKPRFKGRHRPLHSLEGKNNQAGIRWKPDAASVEWNKLRFSVKIKDTDYLAEALACPTKYCRILWRNINGKRRWYVQLIQEGLAPQKWDFFASGLTVGLDIGPSTIAIISDTAVGLEKFAPSVEQPWQLMRVLQRQLDRSRRANNPANYNANGTVKKGAKRWVKSAQYLATQAQLAQLERKLAASRKRDHGELINKILGLGNVVRTETLSYRSFQKNFGRSIKQRAPGAFIQQLNRKAESAGGKLEKLNTWALKMSQYDHVSDAYEKKTLSQRFHRAGKSVVQRDCYSAFLAQHATGNTHDLPQLNKSWVVAEPLLRRARLCINESVKDKAPAFPTVAIPLELIARQRRKYHG
jgi:putative transposase